MSYVIVQRNLFDHIKVSPTMFTNNLSKEIDHMIQKNINRDFPKIRIYKYNTK